LLELARSKLNISSKSKPHCFALLVKSSTD
jgi:hypothetical protein